MGSFCVGIFHSRSLALLCSPHPLFFPNIVVCTIIFWNKPTDSSCRPQQAPLICGAYRVFCRSHMQMVDNIIRRALWCTSQKSETSQQAHSHINNDMHNLSNQQNNITKTTPPEERARKKNPVTRIGKLEYKTNDDDDDDDAVDERTKTCKLIYSIFLENIFATC